jgi:hypothetical protein
MNYNLLESMVLRTKEKYGEYILPYQNSEKQQENYSPLKRKILEDFSKVLPSLEECIDMVYYQLKNSSSITFWV